MNGKHPPLLSRIQTLPLIGKPARRLFFERLATGYESAAGFVYAQDESIKLLDEMATEAEGQERALDRESIELIREEINENRIQGHTFHRNLRNYYPEIYSAITTRQATRAVLNEEQQTLKKLQNDGLIDSGEEMRILEGIEERMKILLDNSPTLTLPNTAEMLKDVPWLSDLDDVLLQKIVAGFRSRVYSVGSRLVRENGPADGLFVIVRGKVKIVMNEEVIEILGTGSVIGEIALLTRQARIATVVAVSPVTVLWIKAANIKSLIRESAQLENRLWEFASLRLATNILGKQGPYNKWRQKEFIQWMSAGEIKTPDSTGKISMGNKIGVLVSGSAKSPDGKKLIKAPSTLLSSGYIFSDDARVFYKGEMNISKAMIIMNQIVRLIFAFICLLSFLGLSAQEDLKERQDSILEEFRDVKPWYEFGGDKITVIPMAVSALDATYYDQDENSYTQVGDQAGRYEPGQIRALRFGLLGTFNFDNPWTYIIAGAYRAFDQGFNADSASDFSLYDLRIDIPTRVGTFSFGKMKEPTSMQREASMIYLGGMERSMSLDGMLPARNTGIMHFGNLWKDRIRIATGIYKQLSIPKEIYWKDASSVGLGRLTVNPFLGWLEHHDLHVGFSGRWSNYKSPGNLRQHPEAYFASKFVETGFVSGESTLTFNYELAYRFKNLLFTSEITRLRLDNQSLGNPVIKGSYFQLDYILTGERRRYVSRSAVFFTCASPEECTGGRSRSAGAHPSLLYPFC